MVTEISRKILDLGRQQMVEGPTSTYRERALYGWIRLFGDTPLWQDVGRTFKLAPHELCMLIVLCKGHAPKAAADILGISHGSARTCAHNIYRAFRVDNQTQLLLKTVLTTGLLVKERSEHGD